ncbi:MAG: hypothetical protein SGCHY_005535 [Lobulomycetales sp.]
MQTRKASAAALELGYSVVYKDQHLIAINKKPGLDTRTLLSSRPFGTLLTHPLDKRVSGLLLLARSGVAAKKLSWYHAKKDRMTHTFSALLSNPLPLGQNDTISTGLVKSGTKKEKMRLIEYHPAFEEMPRYPDENRVHEAITRYRVLDTCDTGSFVSLQSFSHVKHQVRVHAEKIIQSPIIGDFRYGYKAPYYLDALFHDPQHINLYLHSSRIRLVDYYRPGVDLDISVPLPEYLVGLARKMGMRKIEEQWNALPTEDRTQPVATDG